MRIPDTASANLIDITPDTTIGSHEVSWRFSRAGGPGGQKVNRTATRVELLFDVANSPSLSDVQRHRILSKLSGQIDSRGVLHLTSERYASQWRNRQDALRRFRHLLALALHVPKTRIPTRSPRSAARRRLESKRQRGQAKKLRGRVNRGDW